MNARFAPPPDHSGARPGAWLETPPLSCPLCGQPHRAVWLAPSERALCVRCGQTLARGTRFGRDASTAFASAGLLLAVPAMTLPFVTVGKLGNEISGSLFTGVDAFWRADLRLLAIWIFVCAAAAPLILLGTLAGLLAPPWIPDSPRLSALAKRIVASLETWAMPEVQLLAVLVAFSKLGSLVDVTVGPGLWCYGGMAIAALLAWRAYALAPADLPGAALAS